MGKVRLNRQPQHCPISGKVRNNTEAEADAEARRIERQEGDGIPRRSYKCECGGWEVTRFDEHVEKPREAQPMQRRVYRPPRRRS